MKLKNLIQNLNVRGSKEIELTGISNDSRTIAPGNLFIAKKGDFIADAILHGAAAIVTKLYNPFIKQTQVICEDPGKIEAHLAAKFYQNPSTRLFCIGVTGTKGKTTSSYLIHHLLNQIEMEAGLIGTVEAIIGPKRIPSMLTTHDAVRNQKLLSEMVAAGAKAVVLEVSSHGLVQGRVEEIDFDIALFTNLFSDHLDYHKTIEEYAAAKRSLFEKTKVGIYNADSPWCASMQVRPGLTFGITSVADVMASGIQCTAIGTTFKVTYLGQSQIFTIALLGRFNVYNLLGAICIGIQRGISLAKLSQIFSKIPPIPGRLERVENALGFSIFVDFAHSGEALDNVLSILKEITEKRLIVVFGCGGNRDPARRIEMGKATEKWADLTIITTDNPRNEDPEEICRQILQGFEDRGKVIVEMDRKEAITKSIELAGPKDIILIAGKGHEKTQIFKNQRVPFDDVQVVKEALKTKRASVILV